MNDREWLTQRQFAGMSLGLERIEPLLERLGDPQLKFPSIHVAGTNGKGSLCALLSSAACDSGFKTGLFTTPHLVTVEERIRIDGKPISPEEFDNYLNRIRMASEALAAEVGEEPTFYEATFAIAMLAFSDLGVQRGIIETGMGGAGDATRLVDADLCVITTISLDHTEVLGPTLVDIARAKIGIQREGVPIVALQHENSDVMEVLSSVGDDIWFYESGNNSEPWRIWNEFANRICLAMNWNPVNSNTIWPGRSHNWPPQEWFNRKVRISAAHNLEGLRKELDQTQKPCIVVIGMTEKENLEETLSDVTSEMWHSNIFRHFIITEPTSGRKPAVDAEILESLICANRLDSALIRRNPAEALESAVIMANQEGVDVLVLGSVYLVGDIIRYVVKRDELDLWQQLVVH